MIGIRGALVEIVERRKKPQQDSLGASLIVPNEVRINGQQIAMPANAPITVHEMSRDDAVKVTLTVFARRIFVGQEDVSDETLTAVRDAQQALADAHARNAEALADYKLAVEQAHQDLAEANRKPAEETA